MTVALLVALEERERVDALRDEGRVIGQLWDLRDAIWGKEGPREASESWQRAIAFDPRDIGEPGKPTQRELETIKATLAEIARSNANARAS